MVMLTNWPPEQITKLAKYSQDSDFHSSSFDSSFVFFLNWVCTHLYLCQGTFVEVGKQLLGIFLQCLGPRDGTQSSGLTAYS